MKRNFNRNWQRMMAVILTVCFLLSLFPTGVYARNPEMEDVEHTTIDRFDLQAAPTRVHLEVDQEQVPDHKIRWSLTLNEEAVAMPSATIDLTLSAGQVLVLQKEDPVHESLIKVVAIRSDETKLVLYDGSLEDTDTRYPNAGLSLLSEEIEKYSFTIKALEEEASFVFTTTYANDNVQSLEALAVLSIPDEPEREPVKSYAIANQLPQGQLETKAEEELEADTPTLEENTSTEEAHTEETTTESTITERNEVLLPTAEEVTIAPMAIVSPTDPRYSLANGTGTFYSIRATDITTTGISWEVITRAFQSGTGSGDPGDDLRIGLTSGTGINRLSAYTSTV